MTSSATVQLKQLFIFCCLALLFAIPALAEETSITQHGITWTFDKEYETGTFVNGDYWIIGPATVISISNDLNTKDYPIKPGQNGSMINPVPNMTQGYDSNYQVRGRGYRIELNAALPQGQELSADNPLILKPDQSLISAVSWLWNSKTDKEPGCPRIDMAYGGALPALRSAAFLTCLSEVPAANSFRPAYCGNDKSVKYTKEILQTALLKKLAPVDKTPSIERIRKLEKSMSKPWIDHFRGWVGRTYHPSDNMPNYGRDFSKVMLECALLLHLDFDSIDGIEHKDTFLINLVQYGIDLAGIADAGGYWPPDGGHAMGRKWPILFAGLMLNDKHMKNVGHWDTMFQEDAQTFYIDQKAVDITNGPKWNPDKRSAVTPYSVEDIGTAEWGIRHATEPTRDHKHWDAKYRDINNCVIPGFALVARIMGQKQAWNHDPLFDYADRVMQTNKGQREGIPTNSLSAFAVAMWENYREQYERD